MTIREKLSKIQMEMKAPKSMYNSFGKYSYRNAEGILEAFKPYEAKYNVMLTLCDDIVSVGDRYYIKATATLSDCESEKSVSVYALAREADTKKGMDDAQVTGATSSYARKYALNGLFLLDDTKDADTDEYTKENDARTEAAAKAAKKENKESVERRRGETQAEAKKNQKLIDDVNAQLIDDIKKDVIKKTIAKKGLTEQSVLKAYQIKGFDEMTVGYWNHAVKALEKYPDVEQKNKKAL